MADAERRPRRRPVDAERQAQLRAERLEALHQQLADGVAAITDGPAWRAWLDVAGRFHRYSFGNQLLIAAQRPDATLVAGYRAWQAMGRQVRKGESAIWLLAPITRRVADHQAPEEARNDPDPEGQRTAIVGWGSASVFDVGQTDGEPLPTPPAVRQLDGQAPTGLWDCLAGWLTERGWAVQRCPDPTSIGGANGLTDLLARTVTVRADVSDAQAVKSLAHEAGHVLLHTGEQAPGRQLSACRDLLEVEAESVAYLVAAHHGLNTADYTFAYVAAWAGRDADAVQATAARVLAGARTLIGHTDPVGEPTVSAELAERIGQATHAAGELEGRATASRRPAATATAATGSADAATDRILAATQQWFLTQSVGDPRYTQAVTARGHTPEDCRGGGIGWAPATWTALVDHLRDRGYTPEQLLNAGVAISSRGRLLDRFRGRITFPIHHPDDGAVVGWTARDALASRPDTPKYLNSPAAGRYDKSRLLYGVEQLTPTTATVVLVEGPWDAYAVTRTAAPDTVGLATCGTAVTADHLQAAIAEGRRLVLGVDRDPAGLQALGRTLDLTRALGLPHPDAVLAGHGKDFADRHAHSGPTAVRADLDNTRPAGIVHAHLLLAVRPPADTAEARIGAARAAAGQAEGLTPGGRAHLADLLIRGAGITSDAALNICLPGPTGPRPAGPVTRPVQSQVLAIHL